jgi:hypothetical protein
VELWGTAIFTTRSEEVVVVDITDEELFACDAAVWLDPLIEFNEMLLHNPIEPVIAAAVRTILIPSDTFE